MCSWVTPKVEFLWDFHGIVVGFLWDCCGNLFENLMSFFFGNLQGFSRYLLGNFRNL